MNTPRSIITGILALLLATPTQGQEPIKPLGAEWANLAIITGFHQVLDKQNEFEVRLLEADGSATVAMNPVALYVVITNSSSAADLQSHVWLLPHGVSKVQGVELSPPTLRIRAEVDADPWDSAKRVGKVIKVRYTVSHGILSNTLSISEEPLQ